MRRELHSTDGTSTKCWRITCTDATIVIQSGRIGSTGRTLTKTCPDGLWAWYECEKRAGEKRKQGSQEVSVGETVAPAPVSACFMPSARNGDDGPLDPRTCDARAMISVRNGHSGGLSWNHAAAYLED